MESDIQLFGKDYRVDLESYKVKDILDFAPRASVPGGSVVMSDLGLYQPLVQSDFRHGFGFQWYSDASGYMRTEGNIDTRQDGLAMLMTQKTSSDTNNANKEGFTTWNGKLWAWGTGGLRVYDGSWANHTFSGIEKYATTAAAVTAADTLTFQHTVPTIGQNRILIVEVATRTNVAVSSITFNGDALTSKSTVAGTARAEIWYLLNPDEGTGDVVITMAAVANFAAGATTYLYVDQTVPFGTAATTSGNGTTASVAVTAAVGDVVIAVVGKQGGVGDTLTIGALQTSNWLKSYATGSAGQGAGSYEPGAASTTMSWTWTNTRQFAITGIALKPAANAVVGAVNYALAAGDYLFYAPDGGRLRKVSLAGVDSVAGLNTSSIDYKWLIVHNGYIFAGIDGSNRVHYSDQADLSDLEGTTADPGVIYVGSSNMPTLGAIVYAGNLYITRQDGLWHLGEDFIARKAVDYANEASDTNFRSLAVVNGFLIYPIRDHLIQWNSVRVNDITPEKITDSFPYTTYGRFDNFVAVDNFLYFTARTNEATYIEDLIAFDGTGFHKLMKLATGNTDTVTAMGYDVINNRLWYHLDATADVTYYIQMQNQSPFPYANFPTSGTHSIITSRLDMGFRRVQKSMASLIIEAENLSTTRTIKVYYQIDGDGTWYLWDTITDSGTVELSNPGGFHTREFNYMQLRFDLATDSTSSSPIFNAYTLRFIMRPNVLFGWNMNIIGASDIRNGLNVDERSSSEIVKELREWRDSKAPGKFVDILGDTYIGYVTAISEQPRYRREKGEDEVPDIEYLLNVNFVSVESFVEV